MEFKKPESSFDRDFDHDTTKRNEQQQQARSVLRDASRLSSPGQAQALQPSFLITKSSDFPFLKVDEPVTARGHMSAEGGKEFESQMLAAARAPDVASRDAATGRAAHVVSREVAQQNAQHPHDRNPLRQVAFAIEDLGRDIGKKAGLDPIASEALGHTLRRALETEGLKVFLTKSIDGIDKWQGTATSTAAQVGLRHNLEDSLGHLAERGVSSEQLKGFLTKHAGKMTALLEVSTHAPELEKAATMLRNSGITLEGVAAVVGDKELRHAAGDIAMKTGEGVASMPGLRAAGALAVVGGALLAGESHEDMAKHVFRAAAAIGGGALGSVGGIFGAVAGAEAGTWAANKLIDYYEKNYEAQPSAHLQRDPSQAKAELNQDMSVIRDRTAGAIDHVVRDRTAAGSVEHVAAQVREMSFQRTHGQG